jgi:uncharacterized protein
MNREWWNSPHAPDVVQRGDHRETATAVAGGRGSRVVIFSYRGIVLLSTRLALATSALVCSMLIGLSIGAHAAACAPAPQAGNAGAGADALPAGALVNAPSLYLREAATDRIRWQPWSSAPFALARKLKRPVLIDVGAVWCHWCHVMDETTYADPRVADRINREFVPIKVDSDQRPDVDAYYQDAAHFFSAGGWPLTCFTDADGAPLLILGYVPPDAPRGQSHDYGMLTVLDRVSSTYAADTDFRRLGPELAARLARGPGAVAGRTPPGTAAEAIVAALRATYNSSAGGFGADAGPRFYDFPAIRLALAHGFFGHPEYTKMALDSLRKIAAGGVYDQLGGGFHRYSTDRDWGVPHFEKMSYDQAMALLAYADAYRASGDPEFARMLRSIIGYVGATLFDPSTHTFYSHQDADAFKGDDGSYYTWTAGEVKRALPAHEGRAALLFFGFESAPARAPDGRIVLRRALNIEQVAARMRIPRDVAQRLVERASAGLLDARARRKEPQVDRAVMTDRNALMIEGYLAASAALDDPKLKRVALDALDFLLAHLRAGDGGFYHVWSESKATVPGLAADQVYLLGALLAGYQASGRSAYLQQASALADFVLKKLRRPDSGLVGNLDESGAARLLPASAVGPQVAYDQPMPSVQASAAHSIATLAALTGEERYQRAADDLAARAAPFANPLAASSLGTLGLALEQRIDGDTVIAVAGAPSDPRTAALLAAARATYRPFKIILALGEGSSTSAHTPDAMRAIVAASTHRNVPLAFVCAGAACANPVGRPDQLAELIKRFRVTPAEPRGLASNQDAGAPPTTSP